MTDEKTIPLRYDPDQLHRTFTTAVRLAALSHEASAGSPPWMSHTYPMHRLIALAAAFMVIAEGEDLDPVKALEAITEAAKRGDFKVRPRPAHSIN